MHNLGEDVHIAAWPTVRESHAIASRHYAMEGRCFVLAAGLVQKATAADAMLRRRFERLGYRFDAVHTEWVGWNAGHGPMTGPPAPDPPEVQLRVAVRSGDKASVERSSREMAPLVLTGPPSVTGYAGGRARVQEVVAYWPALVRKDAVDPGVVTEVRDV